MIPKKIHYFWFGKADLPPLAKFCIETWKTIQPDFEIIEWNESNFDVYSNAFIKEAYELKKYAFVADYARGKILYEYGGFYMDIDMELKMPLNEFLEFPAVCGFELKGVPYSAFFGTAKGHELAKDIKEYYEKQPKFEKTPNTKIFSELLVSKYGANAEFDEFQKLKYDIHLFPSSYFSLDFPKNYVTHHFSGTWHNDWTHEKNPFKSYVNAYGIVKMFTEIPNGKTEMKNLIFNHKRFTTNEILDQIPLSYIISYVKQKLMRKIGFK